jgi:antitoxin CptB
MGELGRLRWRCRRGMLELDCLLLRYFDDQYAVADVGARSAFERLLTLPDPEILALLSGQCRTEDPFLCEIIERILGDSGAARR